MMHSTNCSNSPVAFSMVMVAGSACNGYVFGRFLEEVGGLAALYQIIYKGFGGLGHCV